MQISKRVKGITGVLVLAATLILGWIGLGIMFPDIRLLEFLPDRIYKVVKIAMGTDPTGMLMQPDDIPWQLLVTKILVVFILLATFLKLIQKLFYDQYVQLRLMFFHNHTIVCGINEKGSQILKDLKKDEHRKGVGIEISEAKTDTLTSVQKEGHVILHGDATEKETLLEAGVTKARNLICYMDKEQVGIEISSVLHEIYRKKKPNNELNYYLHLSNLRLIEVMERADRFEEDRQLGIHLHFFNHDKMISRSFFEMFVQNHAEDILSLSEGKHLRLIFFGFGQLTTAMMVQAFRILHFSGGAKTEIVVIDKNTEYKKSLFREEYPFAEQIFTAQFVEYNGLYSNVLREYVLNDDQTIPVLIFAFREDEENIRLALEVLNATPDETFRMYVRNSDGKNVGAMLKSSSKDSRLNFFGDLETFCQIEYITGKKQDSRARTIHENYLAKQQAMASTESASYKTAWNDLSEDARDSNRAQADHIPYKLAELGLLNQKNVKNKLRQLAPDEVERLAIAEHDRWSANRILNGWQFGDPRNDKLKLHPSLIPWEKLSESEKQKDRDTVLQLHELV